MFSSIFGFEWRFRRRSLMFKIFCALFFALTVLLVAWEDVNMPAAGGKIARNSPHAISVFFIIISQLGMFVAAAFVAGCVQRDRDYKADSLFYSMPISRHGYLAGRFFGSLLPACLVAVAAALAHALASAAPWLPAEKIVAFTAVPYLTALAYFAIPNFFIMGALAFAVSTLTRRLLWGYVALILVLLFNGVSQSFLTDLDNQVIAAFADPFGATAWSHATRYWTIAEKNSQVLLADGLMLGNRALWIAVAAGLLALTHARVRLAVGDDGKRARKPAAPEPTVTAHSSVAVPSATRSFGFAAHLAQLRVQLVGEVRWVIKKIGFVILVAFGMVNVAFLANALSRQLFGTPVFPVTRLMLEASANGFSVFMLAIITVYSGALVWRERESKIHEIYDALPIPDWIPLVSKLTALLCAVLLLLFGSMLASLGYQLANGFMTVELGLFVKGLLLVEFPGWIEVAVLGFAIQVLVNHKYLGFGVMTAYFLALIILPQVGVEHNLVLYGQTPGSPYSDMNGYGHFATPLLWFHLYWLAAAAILGLAANLFWVRGTDDSLRLRAREARRRVNRLNTTALVAAAAVFFATGGYIFYNTNVLNTFKTSDQRNEERAEFERKYKQYEDVPQPRVTAVKLDVDIYPYERKYHVRGDMTLVNKTDAPIAALHVVLDPEARLEKLSLPEAQRTLHDTELGYSIYELSPPLAPKAEMVLHFELWREHKGFVNSGSSTNVIRNGTFFNNVGAVPSIGYSREFEIQDPDERRKQELPERERMAKVDDMKARMNTYISHEADWIDFEAIVSTVPEQIAIAPGYLQKEWEEGGRRYFHYKMDAPILNFYAFLSADYQVVRDQWNDVTIEVYHHAPHDYNVQKMIKAVKDSLTYFTENFSPYQHRQARIIEFPRYATFAQSFPNTIPYSEGIGFIAKLLDPNDIDYVYYVTAHEIAHQWWAHQVIGGNVQGGTLMSETMAQYSALMVMEKEYGKARMKKFLRYELDNYLRSRGTEQLKEMPLLYVENQPYIHYRKGSVVMYALREYIGEAELNAALAAYIKKVGFQQPPFTNSLEFIDFIRAATPDDRKYIIEDWFENITLYDNKAIEASYAPTADGKFKVKLKVKAGKLRADELGEEREVEMNDFVQIGVLGAPPEGSKDEEFLSLEMHRLPAGESELEVIVDKEPIKAGIDPMILLIDRNPDDNVIKVTKTDG